MYDLLLPPDIKGLKSVYIDHNFVTLHWIPSHAVFARFCIIDWIKMKVQMFVSFGDFIAPFQQFNFISI